MKTEKFKILIYCIRFGLFVLCNCTFQFMWNSCSEDHLLKRLCIFLHAIRDPLRTGLVLMWVCTTLGMAVACNSLLEGAFYEEAQCICTSSDAFSPETPASVA